MLRGDMVVFDEFVVDAFNNPVFTPSDFNGALGASDVLAIFAVVDQQTATTTLIVELQHSADGRVWLKKNTTSEISANNTFPATGQAVFWGYSTGGAPTLGQARLKISFGAPANAHVRIHVTLRDPR